MEIIFHIGFHKTGSSSIQQFFHKNRELFKERFQILYPKSLVVGFAHHGLVWSIKKSSLALHYGFISDAEKLLELISEIKEINLAKIIISSEFLSNLTEEDIETIKKQLCQYLEFQSKIIIYSRRQDITIESLYSQNIKTFETKEKRILKDYLNQIWINTLLNYYNLLSSWQEAFPEAQIIPRVYDRTLFPEGNVILDFLSVLGIDMPEAREYKIEANPSLSHLSTLVMRKINEKFDLTPEEHGKVITYLFKLDREEGSPIKSFFALPERISFLEYFRESNERLFTEWFGTENKFVLTENEIKFYEEQDRIPKEEIEKLIEDRYRKVLAYMMEERLGLGNSQQSLPKFKINYTPSECLESIKIDVLQLDLFRGGSLTVGGLILLKKEVEGEFKVKVRDTEGEKEAKWGMPSPWLATQYPDNPKAANARFQISNVKLEGIVQVILEMSSPEVIACIEFS